MKNNIFLKERAYTTYYIVAEEMTEQMWGWGVLWSYCCGAGAVKYFSINEEFEATAVITHRQYYVLLLLMRYTYLMCLPTCNRYAWCVLYVRQCKNSSSLYIIDNIFTAGCSYIIIIIIVGTSLFTREHRYILHEHLSNGFFFFYHIYLDE